MEKLTLDEKQWEKSIYNQFFDINATKNWLTLLQKKKTFHIIL